MDPAAFLTIALLQLMAVMSPGPDFFVLLRMSIAAGRRAGVLTALGIGTGNTVHVAYTVLGLAALIAHTPSIFRGIQITGGFVILYLGVSCFRSSAKKKAVARVSPNIPNSKAFLAGFFTNLFNGHATLWYVSIMSQFVGRAASTSIRIAYGVELILITVGWFLLLAGMVGHPKLRARLERWQQKLVYALGTVLIVLAGRVLFQTLRTLL